MTSAVELKRLEEQKKLSGAQGKIRDVLEKEPFGMTIAQLTGMCRYSRKYTKEVLKTMDDVIDEAGYLRLKSVAPVVVANEKKAEEVNVDTLKNMNTPGKIIPVPEQETYVAELSVKPGKTYGIPDGKLTDKILALLRSNPDGISREQIRSSLSLEPKQLTNALLRLRKQYKILLVGDSYKLVEGEPVPVSEQVKSRNAYFDLVSDVQNRIVTRTERRAMLSRDEVDSILRKVFGLNDVQWVNDGVVLSQVDEVA